MVADALNGNIDLIVTKSVSRFVRNTVDSLIELNKQVITEFDESLWAAAIDYVVVQVSGKLTFRFKNGTEIEVLTLLLRLPLFAAIWYTYDNSIQRDD